MLSLHPSCLAASLFLSWSLLVSFAYKNTLGGIIATLVELFDQFFLKPSEMLKKQVKEGLWFMDFSSVASGP